ncbi:MAG: MFS transporter [Candidatus Heimdallarchaeota archaeon]
MGVFWSISIFSSSAGNFIQQFFSAFARIVGVSATLLGFLMSIRNLLNGLFQGVIGRLSDRFGRKYILMFGFALGMLIPIPLIFWEATWLLIVVAVVQAFATSIFIPTWNAVLGDVTDKKSRAAFIGKITSIGRIVSVAVTLLVAGFFFLTTEIYDGISLGDGFIYVIPWRVQYSVAFGIAAFNSLLCIITLLFFKETRKPVEKGTTIPKMRVALQDKNFRKFLLVNSIFGITMSLIWPLNPIIIVDVLELTDFASIAILTSAFTIFTGLSQIIGGKLSDKVGRKPLIIISTMILIFFPVSMIPAVITNNMWVLLLSRFVGGLGTGINMVAISAYSLDVAPPDLMGGYSGLRETFYGIATFIGSFAAGFIIDAMVPKWGIFTTSIAMSIGVTVIRSFAAIGYFFMVDSTVKSG